MSDEFMVEDDEGQTLLPKEGGDQLIPIRDMADDQITINQIQGLRDKFIAELIRGGKLPSCQEDRAVLLKLMSDSSQTALMRLRIKSDSDKAKSDASVAMKIADALSKYNPSALARRNRPVADTVTLPAYTPKPGETDIGVVPVSYQEIMGDN